MREAHFRVLGNGSGERASVEGRVLLTFLSTRTERRGPKRTGWGGGAAAGWGWQRGQQRLLVNQVRSFTHSFMAKVSPLVAPALIHLALGWCEALFGISPRTGVRLSPGNTTTSSDMRLPLIPVWTPSGPRLSGKDVLGSSRSACLEAT